MHPVHANFIPPQTQQTQTAAQTTTVNTGQSVPTTDTETGSRTLSDQIELSPEAVRFLESGDKPRGPQHRGPFAAAGHGNPSSEKAGHSTAAQARAIIEADPTLGEQPFGQIVSQVARGVLSLADVTPEEPAEEPAAADGTDGTDGTGGTGGTDGEVPLAGGTDGTILATGTGEQTTTTSQDQTDAPEPAEATVTNIIEETTSSDEQLLQTPITVVNDTSVSDGELIDLLTEEETDQTA